MRKVMFGIFLGFVALSQVGFADLRESKISPSIDDNLTSGESESFPSLAEAESPKISPSLAEGDKGGGYKNTKDSKNTEFNSNDSTHPLATSAREGEQKGESHNYNVDLANRNDKVSESHAMEGESVESHNDKVSESLNTKIGESSGIILGLGIHYSPFRFTQNYEQIVSQIKVITGGIGAEARAMTTTTTQLESPINAKGDGVIYSLLFGYAGFLEPFKIVQLGMRSYADISASHIDFASNERGLKSTLLRYGLSVDLLLNFIISNTYANNTYTNVNKAQKYHKSIKLQQKATKTHKTNKQRFPLVLGLFAGVRIGGTSYLGDDIDAINRRLNALNNGSFPKGGFDFALNVGVKANIARNNSVELAFALPMYQLNYKASSENVVNDKTTTTRLSGGFAELWSVGVRYIYTFRILK